VNDGPGEAANGCCASSASKSMAPAPSDQCVQRRSMSSRLR